MADQTIRIDLIARKQTAAFGKVEGELRSLGKATSHVAKESSGGIERLGKASGIAGTAILLGVGAALAIGAKAAIDFESQFAGVRKTVDASEPALQRLSDTLRGMSLDIPIGLGDLTKIAELGGQLGVGINDLEEFTDTIAKLGVTTNLSVEDAATGIARLANIMGTNSHDFDNLGSTLVDLGNNFATTEQEILNFGLRLAGIGSTIGLSEADVLGLAAAFTALGEPAERGATAIQRVFVEMLEAVGAGGEKLAKFAEIVGVTQEEFAQMFTENPAQLFLEFEKGLSRTQASGENVTRTLQDLGLGSQRVLGLLLKGASGWKTISSSLGQANDAYKDNLALDEEANKRFGTTASQISLMGNAFRDMTIELGQSTTGFVNFSTGALAQFFTLIKDNLPWLQNFGFVLGALLAAKTLNKLGNAFFDLGIKVGRSTPMLRGMHQGLIKVTRVTQILGGVLGLAATGIALVGLAMAANRQQAAKYQKTVEATVDAMEALREGTADYADVYEAFNIQLKEKTGLFDVTVDLDEHRQFILENLGVSARQLVELAIKDFDEFERRTSDLMARFKAQREEIAKGQTGNVSTRSALPYSTEDAQILQDIATKEANLKRIIDEVTVATARVRAEEKLRREEFAEEFRAANERSGGTTWDKYNKGFNQAVTQINDEEYEKVLGKIEDDTTKFVDGFLDDWNELVDGFTGQMFDWSSAWDGYERVTAVKTSELKKSLGNWVKDQQALTATMLHVTEKFGSDSLDLFLTLPEDLQRALAAAYEINPEVFASQFGLIISTNEQLLDIALESMLGLAERGGEKALAAWNSFFDSELVPNLDGVEEGTTKWFAAVTTALSGLDQELAKSAPEVSVAFQDLLNTALEGMELKGFSTAAIERLTEGLTTAETIAWFHSTGMSWSEAALLGWYFNDLPAAIAADTENAATPSLALLEEFSKRGISLKAAQQSGWDLNAFEPNQAPPTQDQNILNAWYAYGRGWSKAAADGFKSYPLSSELSGKVGAAAAAANKTAGTVWGIGSPSKVFREYGHMVGLGFTQGLAKAIIKPTEDIFASMVPVNVPRSDGSSRILDAISAQNGSSSSLEVNFNGDVANEGEVMKKVQRGVALKGLTILAETAPGRS